MVRFKFYGLARELAGAEERSLELGAPAPLRALLGGLIGEDRLAPSRHLHVILVNGRNCIFLDGLDTLLRDGDLIEILPPVPGG